jgi:hypothetical protein
MRVENRATGYQLDYRDRIGDIYAILALACHGDKCGATIGQRGARVCEPTYSRV